MVHLTGKLEVVVVEARGLPNLDITVFNASNKSDPYCIITAEGINGSRRIGKTFTIDDCLNPKWNYKMVAEVNQDVSGLNLVIKDKDILKSKTIGSCFIDTLLFTRNVKRYTGLFHLTSPSGKPAGSVRVQINFTGTEASSETKESGIAEKFKVKKDDMKTRFTDKTHKFLKHGQKSVVLHGVLGIYIDKAVNLPNLDTSLLSFKNNDVSDPYIDIYVEDVWEDKWKVATTSVITNSLNPVWNESFSVYMCHEIVSVKLVVKDKDVLSSDTIGSVAFRAEDLLTSKDISGDFELYVKGKASKRAKITMSVNYKSIEDIDASPEVPGCYFKMREMNNVTLYQDAHCVGLPPITNKRGVQYHQDRAWYDLYNALINAEEFIYIVGWSVNTNISLLRWENEDRRTIGEILLAKANEGVQVIVMVWDELTSTEFNKQGAMGTSDELTKDFFKDTNVTFISAPRERHTKDVSTKQRFTNFCYTHHQKCIMLDSKAETRNQKQIIAFVGGLDLTNGRFDTPEHPLFDTLNTDHVDDFCNNLCLAKQSTGPREPWHDIHCRIEGTAALDLLTNFKERWNKQGTKKNSELVLVANECISQMNGYENPESWNVQVFRSINSDSAVFPANSKGLSVKKERIFDDSIHAAYIHNIRRSKHFLYMENQYFMGSSHEWLQCRNAAIENLVPLEIAAHIVNKIIAGERYVAYILIPMFPEGIPADKVVQEMLHWQFRTIEMMYQKIAAAIRETGVNAHPQDYLLFFCVGKKEGRNPSPVPSNLEGHAAGAFKHRRLMIYVHSKMIIFDDEYIIVGSANINDRSLSGNRDTEIAVGAFQPQYTSKGNILPEGNVSMFRKSLWLEHMGPNAPMDMDPSELGCVRRVKELAEEGLLAFINIGEEPGVRNLLLYPLRVETDGTVLARDDCEVFPDTVANVIGKRSGYIPTKLTS